MRRAGFLLVLGATAVAAALHGCNGPGGGNGGAGGDGVGSITISLTQAPADAPCLQVAVAGYRTVVKSIALTPGATTVQRLDGLPTGLANVSAKAFPVACSAVTAGVEPNWLTEAPVAVQISAANVTHVALRLVRNGRISVSVDFEGTGGGPGTVPPPGPGACSGGASSSQAPYVVPLGAGVMTRAIFTVGDTANKKPDGVTPYRMVGIPDGTGAFDNGDGTFTWLVNHELGPTAGGVRAHGAAGAFVSKWTIRKCDLAVLKGEDLVQQHVLWNPAQSSYGAPVTGAAMGRLCSADLPPSTAFFDAATGMGYDGRIFMDGEEVGNEGRAFGHVLNGTTYELPRLGKFSWENSLASGKPGLATVVVGTDDSTPGQLYVYVGRKTNAGSPVDRAGLTNGLLHGVKVVGIPIEDAATGIPSGTAFELFSHGNVENTTGAALEAASNAANVTRFARPEDGHWDPSSPNDFYFVTTASFTTPSRLWRLRFRDAQNPVLGGTIDMLLAGTEGPKMMDNITVDRLGHVYLQEDVGGQDHIGLIWRYDVATDTVTAIAEHDRNRFLPGAPAFLTRDEESSGIIDASDILGDGWFLLDVQAHYNIGDPELVEGGQLLALFDPAARFP
jgi:hypothetical protein